MKIVIRSQYLSCSELISKKLYSEPKPLMAVVPFMFPVSADFAQHREQLQRSLSPERAAAATPHADQKRPLQEIHHCAGPSLLFPQHPCHCESGGTAYGCLCSALPIPFSHLLLLPFRFFICVFCLILHSTCFSCCLLWNLLKIVAEFLFTVLCIVLCTSPLPLW